VRRRGLLALAATAVIAGCDSHPAEPVVRLPVGLVEGATDPRRSAISQATAMLLDRPGDLAGKPALAARALGLCEYLATAFQDGRYVDGPRLTRILREARLAWRQEIGMTPVAPPQTAADALLAGDSVVVNALAAPGSEPWKALAGFHPPPSLRRALRLLRETQMPDVMPS